MSFRRQLVVGYAGSLLITIATGVLAFRSLGHVGSSAGQVTHQYTDELVEVERIRFQAERIVATTRGYLLTRAPDYLARLDVAIRELDAHLHTLRHGELLAANRLDLAAIDAAVHDFARRARALAIDASSVTFEEQLRPQRVSLDHHLNALAQRERSSFEAELAHAHDVASRASVLVATATLIGVITSIVLATLVMRRLALQYAQLRTSAELARRAAAAREEMLAIVSHDLRGPLTTVVMGTSLLRESPDLATAARPIDAIHRAAEHMQHLVDQLLDAAQLEAGTLRLRPDDCDVGGVISSAVALYADQAARGDIALRSELPAAPLVIRADGERLLEVLSNLLGNALRFTPAGGSIVVRATPEGDRIRIAIADTGSGIAPEQQPHLFERYWKRDRGGSRGGAGLGLYICRQLVEAHRGEITVESQPGRGTTFHIVLPRRAQ